MDILGNLELSLLPIFAYPHQFSQTSSKINLQHSTCPTPSNLLSPTFSRDPPIIRSTFAFSLSPARPSPQIFKRLMKQLHYINFLSALFAIQEEMSEIEESQVYSPEQSKESGKRQEDQGYKRRVEKTTSNTVEGKWTDEENIKYILFMEYHSKIFASKEKRKSTRIFKSLSELLGTRTPRQCRSHFQKIMNKFKRVNHVKLHYVNQLGAEEYQKQLALLAKEIQPQTVKCDDSEKTHFIARNNVEVQTEPMSIRIQDLPNAEVLKLLHLLQEYQKAQMPFFMSRPVFPNEQPRIF